MKWPSIGILFLSALALGQTIKPSAIQTKSLNNIQFADQAGSIANAYAALPSNGGFIYVPAGTYTQSLGTLNFTKSVHLVCEDPKTTIISFTGATGVGIIFNSDATGGGGGSFVDWAQGMENCQILGPGGLAGSGNAGVGIQFGDATHQAIGSLVRNSLVAGFSTGVTWGNAGAWGIKIDHASFIDNTQDFVYNLSTGGTENIEVEHSVFGICATCGGTPTVKTNGVQIAGSTPIDITFIDTSFDNEQMSISNSASTSKVTFIAPHFEEGSTVSSTTVPLSITGGIAVVMYSPEFLWDATSGSVPASFISVSSGNLQIYGARAATSNTITNWLAATNSGVLLEGTTSLTGFTTNTTNSGGWWWMCPDLTHGGCSGNLTGIGGNAGLQLYSGPMQWTEGTAPSGLAAVDQCYGDSTAHALKCSYNNGTFLQIPQVITATSAAFATATTAGTCVQNTTAVTGATTSMAVSVSPASTPGVGAVWSGFVSSAGNVTINECAVATSAGGTIAFNIRVTP